MDGVDSESQSVCFCAVYDSDNFHQDEITAIGRVDFAFLLKRVDLIQCSCFLSQGSLTVILKVFTSIMLMFYTLEVHFISVFTSEGSYLRPGWINLEWVTSLMIEAGATVEFSAGKGEELLPCIN